MVIVKIENDIPKGWIEGVDLRQLREAIESSDFGGEYRWLEEWLEQHENIAPGCHKIAEHFWLLA